MEILLQPDSLSMVGSMNPFEIYSTQEVTFVLRDVATQKIIVQHTYTPNENNRVTVKVKDIILPLLSCKVVDSSGPYEQTGILKAYEATVTEVDSSTSKTVSFSVLRAGVDKLTDSASNFLKTNFLTWQPNVKAVTYYSPEFLTYYAQEDCVLMAEVSIWNGVGYESQKQEIATMKAGKVWTIPVQYAVIKKLLAGDAYPSYYDVWVEDTSGTRLTYVQRYYASDQKSEQEEWFLFENSLGGIDCFRAYGNSENTAEHTHNVAEIEENSEEYRVDTTRKYKKNTGFLDKRERLWLLDFFPSLGKYHYQTNSLRRITVTESDVNYEARELPSNYSFTYKYSDARPYLNLERTDVKLSQMHIHVPDLGNFTIAPRLVEFPRQTLSDGALFPVQSPYSEEWGVTTLAALYSQFIATMSANYNGGGGIGHTHGNYDLLDSLSEFRGYLLMKGDKLKVGYADEADDFTAGGKASKRILRKDIDDTAQGLITFAKGLVANGLAKLNQGATFGINGYHFDKDGNVVVSALTSLAFDEALQKGFGITKNAQGKYTMSVTNLMVWGKAIFNSLEIRKLYAVGGNVYLSGASSKLQHVERMYDSEGTLTGYKCYILADDGTTATQNGWRKYDQAKCQTFDIKEGTYQNVSNTYYWRLVTDVSSENEVITKQEEYTDEEGKVQLREVTLYDGKKFAWIVLSATDCDTNSNAPSEGDTIVLDGHRMFASGDELGRDEYNDEDRTNVMMLETTGTGTPRITALTGIVNYSHGGDTEETKYSNTVFILSPKEVIFVSSKFKWISESGQQIKFVNYRGNWVEGTKYYYYDQVTYNNALWTCIAQGSDNPTTLEPSDANSSMWLKSMEVSKGEKGDKGDKGDPGDPGTPGKAGENAIRLDLSNESSSVTCDKDGNPLILAQSTSASLYDGATEANVDDVEYSISSYEGLAEPPIINEGGVVSNINVKGGSSIKTAIIYIKAVYHNVSYYAVYTISKAFAGEDGTPAVSRWLEPSATVIKIDKYGAVSPTSISCKQYKQVGDDAPVEGDMNIYYRNSLMGNTYVTASSVELSNVSNITFVEFVLADETPTASDAVVYDRETIPVVSDGKNGKDGVDGIDGINGTDAEGVVMAYKNSDEQPTKPNVTDLANLSALGWSRTPQRGGSYEKVSNISYGSYSNGSSSTLDSTSKAWTSATDDGETWMKSPSGLSDNYGFAVMKVSFRTNADNVDATIVIKAYSEANYDYIDVHALDKEVTVSNSLRKAGVVNTSGNGMERTFAVSVPKAGEHFFYVSYCKDTSGNSNGDYGLFRFDLSDNTVTTPSSTWVSQAVLKDGKAVLPWSEPVRFNGDSGDSALEILVNPETLVFDTDDSGRVPSDTTKDASIACYRDGKAVDNIAYSITGNVNCTATLSKASGAATTVSISNITTQTVDGVTMSNTSGYATVQVWDKDKGLYHSVQVKFAVNVSKFTGSMSADNKKFQTVYNELTNPGTNESLTNFYSKIEQTSREISLKVGQNAVGRNNMLVGSAFRKQDDGYVNNGTDDKHQFIRCSDYAALGGHNAMDIVGMDSQTFNGVCFKNVPVSGGATYSISCMARRISDSFGTGGCILIVHQMSKPNGDIIIQPSFALLDDTSDKKNVWVEKKFTLTLNANARYVNVIFCVVSSGEFYLAKPMMVQGDGKDMVWSMSKQDYDYIGGNLLEGTKLMQAIANKITLYGTRTLVDSANGIYGVSGKAAASQTYGRLCRFNNVSVKAGKDYMLSMYVKRTRGGALGQLLINMASNVKYYERWDGGNTQFSAWGGGGGNGTYSGYIGVPNIPTEWTRIWIHYQFINDNDAQSIEINFYSDVATDGIDGMVKQIKFEEGATMTDWTENRTDLVDKASLKAAGIEITSDKVKLYGNQVEVKPTEDGDDVYALFGEDGFINTNILNVQHVYAKNTSGTVYGHFGYTGAVGGTSASGDQYPLWVGASSCDNAPFAVRNDGYMRATAGQIGALFINDSGLNTGVLSDDTYGTYQGSTLKMNEFANAWNNNNCKFLVASGKAAIRYDPFFLLADGVWEDVKYRANSAARSTRYYVNSYLNNKHTQLESAYYVSLYIKKEIGANSIASRTSVNHPALLVDSDGVGVTSPGGNYFGGLAIGVLTCKTTSADQDASSSIREQLDDNRCTFASVNNCPGKSTVTKFYLPKYPEEGQMLIVLQINAGYIRFFSSTKPMAYRNNVITVGNYWESSTQGQFSVFVYCDGAWRVQFMNG